MPERITIQQDILNKQLQLNTQAQQLQQLELQHQLLNSNGKAIEDALLNSAGNSREFLLGRQVENNRTLNDVIRQLDGINRLKEKLTGELAQLEKDLVHTRDTTEDAYYAYTLSVGAMNAGIPVLLFPVKLETRFHRENTGQHQLWIRVYPDVCQNEIDRNYLTEEEVLSILDYLEAGTDLIATRHGNNRNAFIKSWMARQGANLAKQLRSYADAEDAAQKDDIKKKLRTDIVSTPPVAAANTLPQKFVFRLTNQSGKVVHTVVGNAVPDKLPMAPDEKNNQSAWLHDFDTAVRLGMGAKINITSAEFQNGFSKLVVWGVRHSKKPMEEKTVLENLFDNHFYSSKGLAILRQGTPTNNADDANAGYSWTADLEYKPGAPPVNAPSALRNTESESFKLNDGQWLSQSLGLDDALFQKVENGKNNAINQARRMNGALYPATLGNYLTQMMQPMFRQADVDRIESFFVNYVSAIGPLPVLRIANQPYGILPASVFKKVQVNSSDRMRNDILAILKIWYTHWESQVPSVKRVDGVKSLSVDDMMDILSLHPTSVSFYQRYMEQAETKANAVNATNDQVKLDANWVESQVVRPAAITSNAAAYGFSTIDRPLIFTSIFQTQQNKLSGAWVEAAEPAYGLALPEAFSETAGLRKNYIDWLLTNTLDSITRGKGFDGDKGALLYLLLQYAYQLKYTESGIYLKATALGKPVDEVLLQYKDNQVIASVNNASLSLLYQPEEKITGSRTQSLYEYIDVSTKRNAGSSEGIVKMQHYQSYLQAIRDLPTAALKRAMSGHFDVCSHRLDAWITGVVNSQLRRQRKQANSDEWSKGIFMGAYGYLENIQQSSRNTYGYLLAPSLNHAAAGAILKNAQLSYAGNAKNPYNINISSTRVKWAMHIIECMRNGQELPEVLGYRFERSLHDQQLDKYIKELRDAYPLVAGMQTANAATEETVSPRNVVHGLKLITAFESNASGVYNKLPGITNADRNKVQQAIGDIQHCLDAVKDILMAEGVYQTVSANFDRGAAALDAVQQATHIPDLEVINTSRKGVLLTHRMAWQWPVTPADPRQQSMHALLTPAVNAWLRKVLPDPKAVVCKCVVDNQVMTVTQSDLQLEPIDMLHVVNFSEERALSLLDDLVYAHLAQAHSISKLEIEYTAKDDPASFTFFELGALLQPLRKMIVAGSYLRSSSFIYNSESVAEPYTPVQAGARAGVLHVRDLLKGLNMAQYAGLENQQNIDSIITKIAALYGRLVRAGESQYGAGSLLDSLFAEKDKPAAERVMPSQSIAAFISNVTASVDARIKRLDEILKAIDLELARQAGNGNAALYSFDMLLADVRNCLGSECMMLPAVQLQGGDELNNSAADTAALLSYCIATTGMDFPEEEWLMGIAQVREKMQHVQQAVQYASLLKQPLSLKPLQLPYEKNDRWLAVQFRDDKNDFTPKDKLLYTCIGETALSYAQPFCGIVIDEWTEQVPGKTETAGLSFHYNQPNAEAPQTMLLVTPPVLGEGNKWSMEDVHDTILSTMDLARIRAVEPKQLDATPLAQLLPAMVMKSTLHNLSPVLNLSQNIFYKP